MTAESLNAVELKSLTRKELAQRAKRSRIEGWHGMRKDALVRALLRQSRSKARRSQNQQLSNGNGSHNENGNGKPSGGISNHHRMNTTGRSLDLSRRFHTANRPAGDHVEAAANDPYWIHVQWSFSKSAVLRAEAALGLDWHHAVPVIRVFDVTKGDADGPDYRRQLRDIEIHGDVDHWYVPVDSPGRSYRLHIGYRTDDGKLHALGKSRVVRMPRASVNGAADRNWQRDTKPARVNGHQRNGGKRMNGPVDNGNAMDAHDFRFRVDAELIVHGETHPQAELTLLGEPVTISKEGRFSLRFALPNGRQVIPAVTVTPSGKEQHTIVLAIERNTRELDPQRMDEMV